MSEKSKFETREEWLHAATEKLQSGVFKRANATIPPVQIACGWPSSGGLGTKRKVLGECWDKKCSADGKAQIFISPNLDNELNGQKQLVAGQPGDAMGVLPTLAHELVHATVGHEAKHGKVFGKLARALGLEGKLTSTFAGPELLKECSEIVAILGPYPNGKLDPSMRVKEKKQSTRMIKCECETCGFPVRTTRKWLDEVGAPHCPKHGAMKFEAASDDEGSDDEGEE